MVKDVTKTFPRSVTGDAKSQLIRAADSIVSNIVEGCGAATRKEFARYLDISIKSASELDYRLQLARDDGSLSYKARKPLFERTVEVRKMLFALRNRLLRPTRPTKSSAEEDASAVQRPELITNDERPETHNAPLTKPGRDAGRPSLGGIGYSS